MERKRPELLIPASSLESSAYHYTFSLIKPMR